MSDDRQEWEWKLLSMEPWGATVAQVKEVPGPGRHFLLRRLCGVRPGEKPMTFNVRPEFVPVQYLSDGSPFRVNTNSIHWMVDLRAGNVETLEEMFSPVQVAKPGDVDAETQKQNRLRVLEGRNGG